MKNVVEENSLTVSSDSTLHDAYLQFKLRTLYDAYLIFKLTTLHDVYLSFKLTTLHVASLNFKLTTLRLHQWNSTSVCCVGLVQFYMAITLPPAPPPAAEMKMQVRTINTEIPYLR